MNTLSSITTANRDIKDFFLPDESQIKELRDIIRSQSGHKFTYEETKDVAYQLIRLCECIAGDRLILPGDLDVPK